MRLVHGYEMTRKVLLENRGLQLNVTTSSEAFGKPMTPLATVEHIIADVRQRGDDAVRDITKQVDGIALRDLEIPTSEITSARDKVAPEVVDALEIAANRIQNFHERSRPHSWIDSEEGYGESVTSIERAGIYIPGGTARFPSTVLMSAIPARVAGVDEIIIATNPSADRGIHPVVLVAAEIAKVDRVYQVGGAQAIADSFSIRRESLTNNLPHYTTMTGASAAVDAIEALDGGGLEVAPLQAYFKNIF